MGLTPLLSIEIRMLTLSECLLIIVISLECPLHISVLSNGPHPHQLAKHTKSLNEGKKRGGPKTLMAVVLACTICQRALYNP